MTIDVDAHPSNQDNDTSKIWNFLKTAVFTVVLPGTVVGLVPRRLARRDHESLLDDSPVGRGIGSVSLVLGVLLYGHTAWRFAAEGRGTPSPTDEPERLVTGGIYTYLRNPMYVAVLLCIGGQALLYKSRHVLWYGVVMWFVSHIWIIEYEEPHLAEKHGEVYEQYCDRVPRWMPRLRSADEG